MKKLLKLVAKFVSPQTIVNEIERKLKEIELSSFKGKFLDKLFSYEVKITIDRIVVRYNDLFNRYNR